MRTRTLPTHLQPYAHKRTVQIKPGTGTSRPRRGLCFRSTSTNRVESYKSTPRPPPATITQSTNANPKIPTISSARIPGARKAAAAVPSSKLEAVNLAPPAFEDAAKVSPPPLKPLAGWGLQSSSDDEEEETAAVAQSKSSAAKKGSKSATKPVKGRAPSKDKYMLSRRPPPGQEDLDDDELFMSVPSALDFGDLPSSFDPLADAARAEEAAVPADVVHLRVQKRNGRKTLTTVEGISAGYNFARILRDLKRELCCNGIVVDDEDLGKIIQLQGDHRKCVAAFLVKAGMARKDKIKIHGF